MTRAASCAVERKCEAWRACVRCNDSDKEVCQAEPGQHGERRRKRTRKPDPIPLLRHPTFPGYPALKGGLQHATGHTSILVGADWPKSERERMGGATRRD